MSKTKTYTCTYSFKMSNPFSILRTDKAADGGEYISGVVQTPEGIVYVFQAGSKYPDLQLRFIHNRRLYIRNINGAFTERGISIRAGKFAREIAGK